MRSDLLRLLQGGVFVVVVQRNTTSMLYPEPDRADPERWRWLALFSL